MAREIPDSAYSVSTHPERFEPVVTVAFALIDYLVRTYDVEAKQDPHAVVVRLERYPSTREAVTLAPEAPGTARLSFFFSDSPSVTVKAGVACEERYPGCGCDACDDRIEDLVEDLEERVFAVASGDFREYVTGLFSPMMCRDFLYGRGSVGGGTLIGFRESFAKRSALRPVKDGWQSWPERS